MAKIKKTMTVSLEEFGKKAGEYALDEFEYKGLTIRQWADKITSGEYQPVKYGRWTHPYKDKDIKQCSECLSCVQDKISSDVREMFAYCPFCAAKMAKSSCMTGQK